MQEGRQRFGIMDVDWFFPQTLFAAHHGRCHIVDDGNILHPRGCVKYRFDAVLGFQLKTADIVQTGRDISRQTV